VTSALVRKKPFARIACHEGVASAGFGGGRADGVLEVRPGERERPSHDLVVDRSHGEHANQSFDTSAGKCCATGFLK
jgi:hypothetical protein